MSEGPEVAEVLEDPSMEVTEERPRWEPTPIESTKHKRIISESRKAVLRDQLAAMRLKRTEKTKPVAELKQAVKKLRREKAEVDLQALEREKIILEKSKKKKHKQKHIVYEVSSSSSSSSEEEIVVRRRKPTLRRRIPKRAVEIAEIETPVQKLSIERTALTEYEIRMLQARFQILGL